MSLSINYNFQPSKRQSDGCALSGKKDFIAVRIILDHGSRRQESNEMFEKFVNSFAPAMSCCIVEATRDAGVVMPT